MSCKKVSTNLPGEGLFDSGQVSALSSREMQKSSHRNSEDLSDSELFEQAYNVSTDCWGDYKLNKFILVIYSHVGDGLF